MVPKRGGRPTGIDAGARIRSFAAPIVGQELNDALHVAEQLAKAERRSDVDERADQMKKLKKDLEQALKAHAVPPPATPPSTDMVPASSGDKPSPPPKGGSKSSAKDSADGA